MELDFSARYQVASHEGIAFYLTGYKVERIYDSNWDDIEEVEDRQFVNAIMVGDDHIHVVDIDDLTVINDDEYCPECGQIGCKAYG
jgi:hypothetical protein